MIQEDTQCSRDEAKNLVIRILYGGRAECWCEDYGVDQDSLPKCILELENEVRKVEFEFVVSNPEYVKVIKLIKDKNFKFSSAISYYLGNLEYDCISALTDYLKSKGWDVGANMFDGLLVEKMEGIELPLGLASEYVKLKTGIAVSFISKPMEYDPSILLQNDPYVDWKAEFEKTHFKLMNPPVFIRIIDSGDFQQLTAKELFHCYGHIEGWSDFISNWMDDGSMRVFERVDILPPPLTCPTNVFNTWQGFPVEHFPTGGSADWFVQHLDNVFDPESAVFLLKYFAWVVQKPGIVPGVCPVITGPQGGGKTSVADVMSEMLGRYYGATNNPQNDLLDKFGELKNGKRLVVINDCPVSQMKRGREQIKSLITDVDIRYEKKGCQSVAMRNITAYMMTTNSDEPVHIESSDRRYCILECKSDKVGDFEYFKQFHQLKGDPKNVRAVYDFLMAYDISNIVNLSRERPLTRAYQENKMVSAAKELLFLSAFVSKATGPMKMKDLYTKFKSWATEFGGVSDEKFLRSNMSFTHFIKRIPGVVIHPDNSNGAKVSFVYDTLNQHLASQGVDSSLTYMFDEPAAETSKETFSTDY